MHHDDLPGTDGPGLGPIMMCAMCGTIFVRSKMHFMYGEVIESCPNPICEAPDIEFDHIMEDAIWLLFLQVVGENWNDTQRLRLRGISESAMGPFNPLYRNL